MLPAQWRSDWVACMGGQCPGAPELKGPRERETNKKKMKKRKERMKLFKNTRTGAPPDISP